MPPGAENGDGAMARHGTAPCGAAIFKTDETSVRAGYPYGIFWYRCTEGHTWDSCTYPSRAAASAAAQAHMDAHVPMGFRESGAYQRPDGQWYPYCARCPW